MSVGKTSAITEPLYDLLMTSKLSWVEYERASLLYDHNCKVFRFCRTNGSNLVHDECQPEGWQELNRRWIRFYKGEPT